MLTRFANVEDLATDEERITKGERNAILHHLLELRSALARKLWAAGLHIGTSVLDEFVLDAAKAGQGDICGRVIDSLRRAGIQRPGFLIYPLTRLGMEMPTFRRKSDDLRDWAVFADAGFAVTAQVHGVEDAFQRLTEMAAALGVAAEPEPSSFEHHVRAGNMMWMTRNPLMLIRISSHTGAYYENQFVYTLKIRIAAALVVMLHALTLDQGAKVREFDSSARVNNFETLDIRHYLIGEATREGEPIDLRRVPMNVAALELARLSDLAVTLSTRTLTSPTINAWERTLTAVLRTVEVGYLCHVNMTSSAALHSRVFRRLVIALDWYRQSFGSRTKGAEAIVALAVAFETLLTDHYASGSLKRLERRVGICLQSHEQVHRYAEAVGAVYRARSEIVHTGDGRLVGDIARAQAAFAMCFAHLASRLGDLKRGMAEPIRQLLGDVPEPDAVEQSLGHSATQHAPEG